MFIREGCRVRGNGQLSFVRRLCALVIGVVDEVQILEDAEARLPIEARPLRELVQISTLESNDRRT